VTFTHLKMDRRKKGERAQRDKPLDGSRGNAPSYTSGYATWFTAGGAIRIAHYDVIDDAITRKL